MSYHNASMQDKIVLELVAAQNSPDNNVRTSAELQFNELVNKDPNASVYSLIQCAVGGGEGALSAADYPIDLKQSCLLHLKRCVPKYWSLGFRSFVGPPVHQELKALVREKLLQLATTSHSSKLRNGAAYVIVQIAAADYPDEWPDLLQSLYEQTRVDASSPSNQIAIIGGLTVLNDLFDDLITEEQFWDGGVGNELIHHIMGLLRSDLSDEAKSHAVKLYQNVMSTLQSPEAFSTEERKRSVNEHVGNAVSAFLDLAHATATATPAGGPLSLAGLHLRGNIYKVLNEFVSSFSRKVPAASKRALMDLLLQDLHRVAGDYRRFVVDASPGSSGSGSFVATADLTEPTPTLSFLLIELFQCLTALQHDASVAEGTGAGQLIEDVITCAQLPADTIDEYEADFNAYVTVVTELSASMTVRDAVGEFLGELNEDDVNGVFNTLLAQLPNDPATAQEGSWLSYECLLFLLESIFAGDADLALGSTSHVQLLNRFTEFISPAAHHLLVSRALLMLPKFFEKFETSLQVSTFGVNAFRGMVEFATGGSSGSATGAASEASGDDVSELIKISALISSTFYRSLFEDNAVSAQLAPLQPRLFDLIESVVEDSEEDTSAVLLEAITFAIALDKRAAQSLLTPAGSPVIGLIFKISFKDPADVQLSIGANECVKTLLEGVSTEDYLKACESSLPFIFSTIQSGSSTGSHTAAAAAATYSPALSLSLELLSVILSSAPGDAIPDDIFKYTFPTIQHLLLQATDDQILQLGSQVFNNLVEKGDQSIVSYRDEQSGQAGLDIVLAVVSKFLSPELSDSAALFSGSIILTTIEKFSSVLGSDFLSQILEATVKRLLISKEVITTENLITVFCNLVLSSPEDMINFLFSSVQLPDPSAAPGAPAAGPGALKNGLELVLPIWFSTFEIIRGYEHIKKNTLAIAKLFTLGDTRVESIVVNGDIIPYTGNAIRTRSMQREQPDQYTQISASLKILKLLVGELSFQNSQPDASDYLPEGGDQDDADGDGDDGDGDWEDMDDIGVPNFNKLQSYVDDDEDDDEHDGQHGNEDLKNILCHFFKECTAKNLGNFRKYYELLDDEEKKVITENVIFN